MLRALVTLAGLAMMGVQDFKKREFDERPVVLLWGLAAVPTMIEYYAAFLIAKEQVLFWTLSFAFILGSYIALWLLKRTESGDVFGLAFLFFFNVVSPFGPTDTVFQPLFMVMTAASLVVPVFWWKREVEVSELLRNPHKYVYLGGVEEVDVLERTAPPGSFTLDVVIPKIRELVEKGALDPKREVRVELGTPLLFHLFVSYVTSLIVRMILM